MKTVAVAIALLVACCAQVTVAPLFPLWSAVPDFVLVTYVLVVAFAGARAGMIALPALALMLGFLSDRDPGLLLIAYLPVLPLASWTQTQAPRGMSPFQQLAAVTALAGLWARSTLALGSVVQGAEFQWDILVFEVLLPGLVLDLAFLAVAYLPYRLFGREVQSLDLQRGGLA